MNLRRLAEIFSLLCISVILGFAICEISLRFLIPSSRNLRLLTGQLYSQKSTEGFEKVEDLVDVLSCSNEPGSLVNGFYVNSKGFLTEERPYHKDKDTFRIVTLGDSFGIGVVPYKYNFFHSLEADLKDRVKSKVEVINLSVSCIGPQVYKDIFVVEGVKYRPDLVLVGVFIGNDLTDDFPVHEGDREYKKYKKDFKVASKNPSFVPLLQESKIVQLVQNLLKVQTLPKNLLSIKNNDEGKVLGVYSGEGTEEYDPTKKTLSQETYDSVVLAKLEGIFYEDSSVYSGEESPIKKVVSHLKSIKTSADEIGENVVVVLIPDELQLNDKLWYDGLQKNDFPEHTRNRYIPQQRLKELMDGEGIKYLDLLDSMVLLENKTHIYQPNDTHFNIEGNQEAAKIIREYIEKNIDSLSQK
jgi:hypothetical protein